MAADEVGDRRRERAERRDRPHAVVERPGVHEQREQQRLADALRRDERQRRREEDVRDHRQLLRRSLRLRHEPGERLGRRRQREHPAGDHVHRVQPVVEARDDAEVAAAAPDRPEEVRMTVGVDLEDAAVGGHDLGGEQMVDRQTVLAHEVAGAAAEREPADPDGGCVAEADGEAVRRGGGGDLTRREAACGTRDPAVGVDLERGEAGQVEHDPTLARAVAGGTVAAAADGELDAGLPRERDDASDLAGVDGPHDRRRTAVDGGQEDAPRLVVAGIAGADHRPGELGAEPRDREAGLLCRVHVGLLRSCCFRPSIVAAAERPAPYGNQAFAGAATRTSG